MQIVVKSIGVEKQSGACIVVGVHSRGKLSESATALNEITGGHIRTVCKQGDIIGSEGEKLWLHGAANSPAPRILLAGCGNTSAMEPAKFIKLCTEVARALQSSGATDACVNLLELEVKDRDSSWKAAQITHAAIESEYRFDQMKSKAKPPRKPLKKLTLAAPAKVGMAKLQASVKHATGVANGISLAKDLGNLPANICNPTYLAKQAQKLKKSNSGLKVKILEESDMKKLGMGSLLSVSQGSKQPGKLIVMEHNGGRKGEKPVVLVGKAVTFDTGGISLKPGGGMDEMKFDMCGGASVFGALAACAELGLNKNVVGIVPAVENMPSGEATRPGDIYTTMSGQTVEILNTDAEGRLILCDALTYAERYKPKAVIDVATLTGACVIALGHHPAAVYSNQQALADKLLKAGQLSHDRCWQMPLWDDYQSQLDSNFADIANIGGRDGGSITAACFLSRFTDNYHWAHLDIAGVAWHSGKNKGATGRPVKLLMQYIVDNA
ncbi:MAG: leucyl aminopeptidase [Pseudomonadota bacterium]